MKLRTKLFVPVALFALIAGAASLLLVDGSIKRLIDGQIKSSEATMWSSLEKISQSEVQRINREIEKFGNRGKSEASLVNGLPQVIDASRLAMTGDIDDEGDPTVQQARQQLREFVKPIIAAYRRDTGMPELMLHFHLRNNRSFTRVWRDGWQTKRDGRKVDISDDLSSFRQTVVTVNQGGHQPLQGVEIGRGGFVIRGLTPVIAPDGTHLGSNEVIFKFNALLDLIKVNPLID